MSGWPSTWGNAPPSEWSAVFAAARVWFAPVNTYADIVADPQVRHNKSVIEIDHPTAGSVKLLGHPVLYDGQRPGCAACRPGWAAPTDAVLAELGYDTTDIDRLQAKVGQ